VTITDEASIRHSLESDAPASHERMVAADHHVDAVRQEIADLVGQLRVYRQEWLEYQEQVTESQHEMDAARENAAREAVLLEGNISRSRHTLLMLQEKIEAVRLSEKALHEDTDRYVADLHAAINAFQNSTSWKITAPLRAAARRWSWPRRHGRRVLKLVWLLCTFQFDPILSRVRLLTLPRVEKTRGQNAPFDRKDKSCSPEQATPPGQDITGQQPLVLFIDSIYPRADRDSGSVDAINFIRIFQDLGYQVAFAADAEFADPSPYLARLKSMGVVVVNPPRYQSIEQFLQKEGPAIDVCFLSRVHCGGRHIEQVRRRCHHAKIIFNTVDLHHVREEREARLRDDRRAINLAYSTREREIVATRRADATIVVSRDEEKLLQGIVPGAVIHTVPLIRDTPGLSRNGFAQRRGIAFLGGFLHRPNIDAVHYFLDEIWQLVYAQMPAIEFLAIGADLPRDLSSRRDPGFIPKGYVKDLGEQLGAIRVMVAPLRYGAGAKGKIVSSLSHGVPCVASPIAAEGMGLVHGETIMIADSAQAFAGEVVRLYNDESHWTRLSERGLTLMSHQHSYAAGKDRLRDILSGIRAPIPRERTQVGPADVEAVVENLRIPTRGLVGAR
jgi:hypothetical protein